MGKGVRGRVGRGRERREIEGGRGGHRERGWGGGGGGGGAERGGGGSRRKQTQRELELGNFILQGS